MIPIGGAPAAFDHRAEALSLLDGRGAILDAAREVSQALAPLGSRSAVVGGIAVLLHGYIRTTRDVDVFIDGPLADAAALISPLGFVHDPARREFIRGGIPVHFVTLRQVVDPPRRVVEIDGVRTVSLADLIAMKLRSGSTNLLRAIDLADVIGLARVHNLSGTFGSRVPKDLRPAFQRIVRALAKDRGTAEDAEE